MPLGVVGPVVALPGAAPVPDDRPAASYSSTRARRHAAFARSAESVPDADLRARVEAVADVEDED